MKRFFIVLVFFVSCDTPKETKKTEPFINHEVDSCEYEKIFTYTN